MCKYSREGQEQDEVYVPITGDLNKHLTDLITKIDQ